MAWFVPTLNKLFEPESKPGDAAIIELSRMWVVLNVIRQLVLGALFG